MILQKVPPEISAEVLEVAFLEMNNCIQEYDVQKEKLFTWMYKLTLSLCTAANASLQVLSFTSSEAQPESGEIALG